jgi:hypothetical protein
MGTRPDSPRYPVIKAYFDYLSGATNRALSDFARHLAQASPQINSDRLLMNDVVTAAFGMAALGSVAVVTRGGWQLAIRLWRRLA